MKVWRWIFWFPVLGLPSHTAQNPSQNFPGHFQLSTDFWGIFRKLIIIATVVTISAFAIFFWTTMLVLKLPIYQVNSQQISEKINNAIKENAELMQKISVLEQKITESKKCLLETNRQKEMVSDEPMKLKAFEKGKSENLKEVISMNSGISELLKLEDENDGVKDLQLRALRAKIWMLEESKKNLEKSCNTLKSVKAAKEAEIKLMDMNMESFHEIYKLKVAAAAKKMAGKQEWMEKEMKLSEKEENLKQAEEEIENYVRRLQEIQAQQQQEKETFRQEIAVHKKKTHDIELRAQALERELMVQKRETAHLKHRLEIMQAEESRRQKPVSGGPGWENPPQRDSTTCAGYMKNQGSSPAEDTRKEQVNMATGGPPPFPRPPYMPYHMGGYRESFMGYPPPPPPWWIPRPQPAPLSPEFGEPLWNWNRKLSYPEQAVPVGQKAT
ncbi:transport and Golgi organization protein 1 homolog isoform X3 [Oryctolagus cuniculus]|uniref:transport and Golgi organization protein 1 homolog isoform X3 n=1 Tax=Oryctolagus cuniculus TaxID=9986 RepID=UPI00048B1333|nr:transport and Golgi organization protein 1 homolog isoform X1 [Oryctolagus cuniculus]